MPTSAEALAFAGGADCPDLGFERTTAGHRGAEAGGRPIR